jgi:hypothetical protein
MVHEAVSPNQANQLFEGPCRGKSEDAGQVSGAADHYPEWRSKVVIQDIESCEQTQETLALLKILALGTRQIEEGKVEPAAEVIRRLRERQETS